MSRYLSNNNMCRYETYETRNLYWKNTSVLFVQFVLCVYSSSGGGPPGVLADEGRPLRLRPQAMSSVLIKVSKVYLVKKH